MDSFKIIVIIFMIIIIIKVFILDNNYKEHFAEAEQSIGGVDDQNAINTLAQLARKLMDGGATIPGNLNFKGTTMPLSILSGTASPDAYKFQYGDGTGWRLRFQKDDKTPTMDVYDNGNVNIAGTITSEGAIKIKNKWMIGGSGGASGDDEWVRMTGVDNKGYYGGFAAGKLFTADNTINGRNIFAEIDDLKANAVRKNKDFTIALRDQGNGAVGGGTTLGACGSACGGGANLTGTTDGNRTLILQIRQ